MDILNGRFNCTYEFFLCCNQKSLAWIFPQNMYSAGPMLNTDWLVHWSATLNVSARLTMKNRCSLSGKKKSKAVSWETHVKQYCNSFAKCSFNADNGQKRSSGTRQNIFNKGFPKIPLLNNNYFAFFVFQTTSHPPLQGFLTWGLHFRHEAKLLWNTITIVNLRCDQNLNPGHLRVRPAC